MEGNGRELMMSKPAETADAHANTVGSPPLLSRTQIDDAIRHVEGRWPNQSMSTVQREAWADILSYVRHGELLPALAALAGDYRPDPDKVLTAIRASRPRATPSNDWTNSEPAPAPDWDANRAGLEMCRQLLKGNAA
jgi:hypothetical protein